MFTASSFDQFWKASDSKEVAEAKYEVWKEDKKIKEKYAQFMLQLQALLKERKVQVEDIKLFLTCLQGAADNALTPDMRRAKDIPSFMQSFSRTHSWWNTSVTSHIACFFGRDAGIKLVESYETKLKGHFLRRITLKLPVVGKAREIVVKINRDYNSFSEEKIEQGI